MDTAYRVDLNVEEIVYDQISDFDRDGETTILDATAIQMKLAKVEG